MKLSVAIPVYNEGEPLKILCERIINTLDNLSPNDYEIILIDDRSSDNSWQVIEEIAKENNRIKAARFVRNFGQHNAITAGISLAQGEFIVLMDCDQQDEPEQIPLLYQTLIDKKANMVYALRKNRQDRFVKKYSSKIINSILQMLSGVKYDSRVGTFRIFTRLVRDSYLSMPEKNRFLAAMFNWLGFQYETVEIAHQSRAFGKSKYNFKKQLKLARLGILSSSTKVLSLGIYLGFITSFFSILFAIYNFIMKIFYDVPMGYSSIIISIFISTGVILIVLGVIGEYLREIVEEVKARPVYVIENKINF